MSFKLEVPEPFIGVYFMPEELDLLVQVCEVADEQLRQRRSGFEAVDEARRDTYNAVAKLRRHLFEALQVAKGDGEVE